MTEPAPRSKLQTVGGVILIAIGVSVFLIRLQHAPYALPRHGNLLSGVLALVLGGWLASSWLGANRAAAALRWVALAAAPIVFFFAAYATLAELEEVVVMKATDRSGDPADLRLWIVDDGGTSWVTMPRWKADEHGLTGTRVDLVRAGEMRCVMATRFEDRATVNQAHHRRHRKYAVQRLATAIGLFGEDAGEEVVALRLDPCPAA